MDFFKTRIKQMSRFYLPEPADMMIKKKVLEPLRMPEICPAESRSFCAGNKVILSEVGQSSMFIDGEAGAQGHPQYD